MSDSDELLLDSEITLTLKKVSAVDTLKLEIASDIAKELKVSAPVEIELI